MGKLGSISVQLLLSRSEYKDVTDPDNLSQVLWVFAALMILGAIPAWAWLPDVQQKPQVTQDQAAEQVPNVGKCHILSIKPSKPLELLSRGRKYAVARLDVNLATGGPGIDARGRPIIDEATGLPVGGEGQTLSFREKIKEIFKGARKRLSRNSRLVRDTSSDHELNGVNGQQQLQA
jgi:hypothetical protein